jgi:outer membrane protein
MHTIRGTLAALAFFALAGASPGQSEHEPATRGTWVLGGGSSALFESGDGGDFGDSDFLGLSASGGYFLFDGLLLRGTAEWTTESVESGGLDLDETTYTLTGGLRYYFVQEKAIRPYLGAAVGISSLDDEIDNGAMGVLSDSDTFPILEGELGLEFMIARSVGIDLGLVGRRASSVELFGVEDDLTSLGLVIGLSVWL